MKVTKIGRERPVLYRGKFNAPRSIVSRLAVSQNHLVLAEMTNFNAKIDQFYLAIDNALSAMIMAKEGTLGTTDHREKIARFFKHFGRRAKIRCIAKDDFKRFYSLWSKSRYRLYFPNSKLTWEMGLFASHLYDFAVTEISRLFRSDEIIMAQRVGEFLKVYESFAVLEESSHVHELNQMRLEEEGDTHGGKLELKLLNPWNCISVSLLSDHKGVTEIIDSSEEIRVLLKSFVQSWDKIIKTIVWKNAERIGLGIANAKLRKKGIGQEKAIEEAIEECRNHPELLRFRLSLNFSYASMSAKEELGKWAKIISASIKNDQFPKRTYKSAWENYKSFRPLKKQSEERPS